ncbi:hypothetical protein IB223_14680 [Pseudoxanthomonas sp. PXM03]|uniref:hypothetical protein n=1 Tax=Pseudoxanthomonas sp. PXM03 TaxID=2769284 RepID=UPI00178774DB|nr:hypothetical protein [Pseudoxanthomonas sp. PXM03]MBD9437346.1 hypothetical protein [Pseudoxanthomonas sp. PXM03]
MRINISLISCNNCFNGNTVKVVGRWTRWSITLALSLALTLCGATAWFFLS